VARIAATASCCASVAQSAVSVRSLASTGQSAEIDGLSTTGTFGAEASSSSVTPQALISSFGSGSLAFAAMAGTRASARERSSGRASQTSLQRAQRTVRPASPNVAGFTA
jgi:hypothetical protein